MSDTRYPDPLEKKFERYGFSYRQVHRIPKAVVYEVRLIGETSGAVAYEVIKPNINKQKCIDGTWTPCSPYEGYPSSEQWGSRGWTYITKEEALMKCESL